MSEKQRKEFDALQVRLAGTQWQPVWDAASDAHYLWNTATNATVWELEEALSTPSSNQPQLNDTIIPTTAQEVASEEQHQYQDYTVSGFFNARSNKFEAKPEEHNPIAMGSSAKTKRQMHHYFDYDSWAEQRGRELAAAAASSSSSSSSQPQAQGGGIVKKQKPSKKEMEKYRRKKQEDKKRKNKWLHED